MEFRDLKKQYEVLKEEIDKSVLSVMSSANYISGKQVSILEDELSEYTGAKHCITCANGTDALTISLMAWGIGVKDAVFVPDFTFFSTGEAPALVGAVPIFVDVDRDTYNIDVKELEKAVIRVKEEGKYTPKAVIAVDLFGQPADYKKIRLLCEKYGLLLLEDAAQGFGGGIGNQKACSFGDISITSFFPAKPVGCYGDGGAIFTDNDEWAELIKSLCVHGKSMEDKYNNIRIGMNSRLDTIQAAILLIKLKAFNEYELEQVNHNAELYKHYLKDTKVLLPKIKDNFTSSWAQFTIQLDEGNHRDYIQTKLKEKGIPSMVYYRIPMHLQKAFRGTDSGNAKCCVTEELCKKVLSLPMHPYLEEGEIKEVADVIREYSNCF